MDQAIKDHELIRRTLAGETDQFALLVRRYDKIVFSLALRLSGNRTDAEDLTQESFLRAYKALHRFDLSKPFKPWILKIASNLTINRLKEAKTASLEALSPSEDQTYEIPDQNFSPEKLVQTRELETRLQAEILRLPPKYRLAFTLRYLEDHSVEEISQITDVPVNTVKIHLFRAREFLKDKLKDVYGPSC